MFVNISNHPCARWGAEQVVAAAQWGEMIDLGFPAIDPAATREEVVDLARDYCERVHQLAQVPTDDHMQDREQTQAPVQNPDVTVMVSGEFTFTYHLISLLQQCGYRVVAACTRREVTEETQPDGSVVKTARFAFVQFREY